MYILKMLTHLHIISEIKAKKNFNFLDIEYLKKYLFSQKEISYYHI